jgi:hypothetical protein
MGETERPGILGKSEPKPDIPGTQKFGFFFFRIKTV